MTKKWIAINLLLLAITAELGWQLRVAIRHFKAQNSVAKIQPAPDLKKMMLPEKQAPKAFSPAKYNAAEFAVIPEKNVFADIRSKEEVVVNLAPPEPPPLTVKPILVGITIADNERKASIIEPGAAMVPNDRGGRRAQFKKIGDVYQGYTITEIQQDHIVLTSGTRREVIPLREGAKKATGGKTPILSTRVVPIGQGSIVGGTPISVGGTGVVAPPRTSVTAVGSSSQPSASQPGAQAGASRGAAAQPAAAPSAPAAEPGASRVIRTPFGDVVRPLR